MKEVPGELGQVNIDKIIKIAKRKPKTKWGKEKKDNAIAILEYFSQTLEGNVTISELKKAKTVLTCKITEKSKDFDGVKTKKRKVVKHTFIPNINKLVILKQVIENSKYAKEKTINKSLYSFEENDKIVAGFYTPDGEINKNNGILKKVMPKKTRKK